MEVARIAPSDFNGRAAWTMNYVRPTLIGRPGRLRAGKPRIWMRHAQAWPPFAFQPLFPGVCVQGADEKPRHAILVLQDQGEARGETHIRRHVDLADQLGIGVERGGVAAFMPGRQRNSIEGVEIAALRLPQAVRAQFLTFSPS